MKRKKSKFLTFCFSMMPGAGHMYMGFMKMGVSFMAGFFSLLFLSSWLDIGPLLYLLPLLWFYSFFDCMNKRYSTDEEFSSLEDNYLFSFDELGKIDKGVFKKNRLVVGIILLLLGVHMIWNNIMNNIDTYLPYEVYRVMDNITRVAPQIIISAAIIVVGIKLIMGKKKECDIDD